MWLVQTNAREYGRIGGRKVAGVKISRLADVDVKCRFFQFDREVFSGERLDWKSSVVDENQIQKLGIPETGQIIVI